MNEPRTFRVKFNEPGEPKPTSVTVYVEAKTSGLAVATIRASRPVGTNVTGVDLKTGPYSWQPVDPYFWRGK